jgi:hypothetical protein
MMIVITFFIYPCLNFLMMHFLISNFAFNAELVISIFAVMNNHLLVLYLFHSYFILFVCWIVLISQSHSFLEIQLLSFVNFFWLIYHLSAIEINSNFFHICALSFTWIHLRNYFGFMIPFNYQNLFIFNNP